MGGRGGVVRFVSVLWWVAPVVWGVVVCREQPSVARALGQRAYARRQAFISPPKFCFAPEPVCLDTERRRQSSVPFSGHLFRAI